MDIVTIDQVRYQCRADSDEPQADLERAATAAEAHAARLANRALFKDQAALDAALATVPTLTTSAWASLDSELTRADGVGNARESAYIREVAEESHRVEMARLHGIRRGIVATPDIIEAILLLTGHYYVNREEVTTGQGATSVRVHAGAEAIMSHHRFIGVL